MQGTRLVRSTQPPSTTLSRRHGARSSNIRVCSSSDAENCNGKPTTRALYNVVRSYTTLSFFQSIGTTAVVPISKTSHLHSFLRFFNTSKATAQRNLCPECHKWFMDHPTLFNHRKTAHVFRDSDLQGHDPNFRIPQIPHIEYSDKVKAKSQPKVRIVTQIMHDALVERQKDKEKVRKLIGMEKVEEEEEEEIVAPPPPEKVAAEKGKKGTDSKKGDDADSGKKGDKKGAADTKKDEKKSDDKKADKKDDKKKK